jgi:hypothetical protein
MRPMNLQDTWYTAAGMPLSPETSEAGRPIGEPEWKVDAFACCDPRIANSRVSRLSRSLVPETFGAVEWWKLISCFVLGRQARSPSRAAFFHSIQRLECKTSHTHRPHPGTSCTFRPAEMLRGQTWSLGVDRIERGWCSALLAAAPHWYVRTPKSILVARSRKYEGTYNPSHP